MFQISSRKKIAFFTSLFICLVLTSTVKAQNPLNRADSLFAAKQYKQAAQAYYIALKAGQAASEKILLKMAFAGEASGQIPYTLYALVHLRRLTNSTAVAEKLSSITRLYNLEGYRDSDAQFIASVIKNQWWMIAGIYLVVAGVVVFFLKEQKRENRPVWGLLVFLGLWSALFLLLFNLRIAEVHGINLTSDTLLMDKPSHAANTVGKLKTGERIKIKSVSDYWTLVEWNKGLYYVKTKYLLIGA